jgi:hypothetical protein
MLLIDDVASSVLVVVVEAVEASAEAISPRLLQIGYTAFVI